MKLTLRDLRAQAVLHTMCQPTTLARAIERLSFVQADPIRAPARAQDLILRHRVEGYRAEDLERDYVTLNIEEGLLYAYGFLTRPLWQLRYPPNSSRLPKFEKRLLEVVRGLGVAHPADLQAAFGGRALNAWGGYSSVAQLALERLHRRGLLRVIRREKGIRVYEPSPPPSEIAPPAQVFRTLVLAVADILGPISEQSLRAVLAPIGRSLRGLRDKRAVVLGLLREGELAEDSIDGIKYMWPVRALGESLSRTKLDVEVPRVVRFLAPFDPVVWDRRRFEHLWGWAYRFEAYTPAAKRLRGYYAMPLSWADRVIGWANVQRKGESLDAELGFVERRPREREFGVQLEAEIERMRTFLQTRSADEGSASGRVLTTRSPPQLPA